MYTEKQTCAFQKDTGPDRNIPKWIEQKCSPPSFSRRVQLMPTKNMRACMLNVTGLSKEGNTHFLSKIIICIN